MLKIKQCNNRFPLCYTRQTAVGYPRLQSSVLIMMHLKSEKTEIWKHDIGCDSQCHSQFSFEKNCTHNDQTYLCERRCSIGICSICLQKLDTETEWCDSKLATRTLYTSHQRDQSERGARQSNKVKRARARLVFDPALSLVQPVFRKYMHANLRTANVSKSITSGTERSSNALRTWVHF